MYTASAKKVRISPRKARLVVDLIRGRSVIQALGILESTPKKASGLVKGVLKSAIANAEQQDQSLDMDNLKVLQAYVNDGETLKRFQPRAYGRGARIRKRSSHITVKVG